MSGLQGAMKMIFSEGFAKVGVNVTTMDSTRSVLFFTSKPLLVLVISRHKN